METGLGGVEVAGIGFEGVGLVSEPFDGLPQLASKLGEVATADVPQRHTLQRLPDPPSLRPVAGQVPFLVPPIART